MNGSYQRAGVIAHLERGVKRFSCYGRGWIGEIVRSFLTAGL